MTDPLRSDRSTTGDASERGRDARIEELLLNGLDHYFAGQHELSINVWTRVLFLDRSHGKARAYIERARGAIAEKQREVEELLHSGAAALARGDRAAARQLLTSAAARGTSGEDAVALLRRLDGLEAAPQAAVRVNRTAPPPRADHRQADGAASRRDPRLAWVAAGIVTGIVLAAVVAGYLWLIADPFELTGVTAVPAAADEPLAMPTSCEMRLSRARFLFAEGKLHEALNLLEPGDPDQLHRAGFDELRVAIQRQLLETGRRSAGFPMDDGGQRARGARLPAAASSPLRK